MQKLRKLPLDPIGIDDYVVRAKGGEPVGAVAALLERRGERMLVVESGVPALRAARRVLSWEQVEQVDHDALAVWLHLDSSSFGQHALELDPAEAARTDGPRADSIPPAQHGRLRSPGDRRLAAKALALFALTTLIALIATIAVSATGDSKWALLYVLSALSTGATAVLGYRAYRSPYEPRATRKP